MRAGSRPRRRMSGRRRPTAAVATARRGRPARDAHAAVGGTPSAPSASMRSWASCVLPTTRAATVPALSAACMRAGGMLHAASAAPLLGPAALHAAARLRVAAMARTAAAVSGARPGQSSAGCARTAPLAACAAAVVGTRADGAMHNAMQRLSM
eukprot:277240-Chlamydomonas_euryale.AAC.3